ncbi:hypothetical protein NLG97_g5402 [Lecanicillium saksenae]|uniref:Uncharacterized protein n=1 Tax=Lecanicillium saksenae TaxID=468837 RepID=A0ACC1QSJ2_9HYPO|nr:hypothetical protein NLG97_g5402 [Lecanicillium saksenae]
MNNQQDETNVPAWSPTPDAMTTQTVQPSTFFDVNDPSINDMIQGPHREPWSAAFVGQRQPRNSASSPWQPFTAYRENNILSEDGGTAPESLLEDPNFRYVPSVASYSGAAQEAAGTSHMGEMLGDIHIGNLGPHMPSMRDNAMDAISTYSSATAATGHRGPFRCTQCQKICKSQSNLKKHELTHSRPHLCNYRGCSKSTEGFSTPNDLQRHKASVHKEASFGYQCTHPDCTRGGEPKIWPRKDNFRTHLSKVHKIEISPETADSEYRIKPDPQIENTGVPNDIPAFEGLTSPSLDVQLPDANTHVADPVLMDTDQPQYDSQQTTSAIMSDVSYYPVYDANPQPSSQHPSFQGVALQADVSFGAESAQSLPVHQSGSFCNQSFAAPSLPMTTSDMFGTQSTVNNAGYQAAPPQGRLSQDTNGMDDVPRMRSPRTSSVFSAPRGSYTVASSQATTQTIDALCHDTLVSEGYTPSQLVATLATYPAELLEQALKSKPQSSCTSNEPEDMSGSRSGAYPCSQCAKVCNRACELKKHMKRHDRPYGCTVQGCGKSFGSKNDWKRHESGQHSAVEAWACEEDGCVAVFEDRLAFTQHLNESHDMIHEEDLQSKIQSCRIGRQCDSRFWCGFCRRVVEIDDAMVQEDGGNGTHWSRRFDHIDGHLFGKGGLDMKSKSQWRFLEDEAKGDPLRRVDRMSATASVRSTTTSNGATYKRKGSAQADSRPRKRADGQWAAGHR